MKSKYKLIYLEWADTTSPIDHSWWSEKECIDWAENDDYWVRQAGFLIKETKKYILIADKYNTVWSQGQEIVSIQHLTRIPTTWIRKRKILN